MTTYLTDWTVADSRARACKRWSLYPEDVLDLTVAEMDLPVAAPIMDAMRDAVERQAFGYPLPDHASRLPAIAAEWLDFDVSPEQVRMTADVIKPMVLSLRYFSEPGTPVAVITPTYSRFADAVAAAERERIEVPMLRGASGYALDLDGVEHALRAGARSVLLCNPSNPVGRVFARDELAALRDLVTAYGARTIADEIHAPLRYGARFTPYASLDERAITLTSASKAWNIPGLRCALIVFSDPTDIAVWDALPRAAKGGISPLGIEATIAAFEDGRPWLEEALRLLDRNRRMITDVLGEHLHMPEGTYLAWLDLGALGDPAAVLLERARVATTAGEEHGAGGEGFVRLNFATPPDVLEDALSRIARVLRRPALAA